jgi:hypothetical protein
VGVRIPPIPCTAAPPSYNGSVEAGDGSVETRVGQEAEEAGMAGRLV